MELHLAVAITEELTIHIGGRVSGARESMLQHHIIFVGSVSFPKQSLPIANRYSSPFLRANIGFTTLLCQKVNAQVIRRERAQNKPLSDELPIHRADGN